MIFLKRLWQFIKIIFFVAVIVLTQIFVINFLPFPLSAINIAVVAVLWYLMFSLDLQILFLVIPVAFFLEIFSAESFGIIISALVISLAIVGWVLSSVFTNRSPLIVFLSGLISVVLYRVLFFVGLLIFGDASASIIWSSQNLLSNLFYESVLTASVLVISYLITLLLIKKFRPEYINLVPGEHYGRQKTFLHYR
ncbi:MAG: hypothetical protein WCX97_01010 [Candidatus Magasanikbacteria bacterium]